MSMLLAPGKEAAKVEPLRLGEARPEPETPRADADDGESGCRDPCPAGAPLTSWSSGEALSRAEPTSDDAAAAGWVLARDDGGDPLGGVAVPEWAGSGRLGRALG